MTVQQLIWVIGISVVYTQLFNVDRGGFVPRLAYGIAIWGLIIGSITAATTVFEESSAYMSSSTLPLSFYLYQSLANQLITFAHSAAVLVIIPVAYRATPGIWAALLSPLALALIVLNAFATMLWLAPLSMRFRDVRAAINSMAQLLMFLTPIFWDPQQLPGRHWFVVVNPMAWPVLSLRDPLMGQSPDGLLWMLFLIATVLNTALAATVFARTRNRIRYWL